MNIEKTVLVTGANGFIGKNLCSRLRQEDNIKILSFDQDNTSDDLELYLNESDFIFHLAGINRPKDEKEFDLGNRGLTEEILNLLTKNNKKTPILMASSIQATLDNPYGKSKKSAEEAIFKYAEQNKSPAFIYRLPNVFGKWCKPNYNSVVATFCYNASHNLKSTISDPSNILNLVYIDDVVSDFIKTLYNEIDPKDDGFCYPTRSFMLSLQELFDKIDTFKLSRDCLILPNLEDIFDRFLYATYVSYLDSEAFGYELKTSLDERGWLAEFIKSYQFGQIFVSKTKPGVTRGNHWHHTKIEKFLVVEGSAEICFRGVNDFKKVIKYDVSGDRLMVLDIPVGYTHSIKNTGKKDLITIFWADEIFDPSKPDTIYESVII